MGHVKVTVQLTSLTGLPEDNVNNTLYYVYSGTNGDIGNDTDITTLKNQIVDFYNTAATGHTLKVCSYLGEQLSRASNACKMLFYGSAGSSVPTDWGSPVFTKSWTLGVNVSGLPLPSEVALVCSFHGDLTDVPETAPNPSPPPAIIRPASRLRSRIYLGPLEQNVAAEDATTHEYRPTATALGDIAASAAQYLLDPGGVTPLYVLRGASKASDSFFEITGGFLDNSFDTQRRRGQRPTSRVTF